MPDSPLVAEEYPAASSPHKFFREQTRTNNDRENQNEALESPEPKLATWEPEFSSERHGPQKPGLHDEDQSPGLMQEGVLGSAFQQPAFKQEGVLESPLRPSGTAEVARSTLHAVSALSRSLGKFSFVKDDQNINFPGDTQLIKRPMEDVPYDEHSTPHPALKQRKTTRDFSSASQPIPNQGDSHHGIRSRAPGSRIQSLAQVSSLAPRRSRIKHTIPGRHKSWTQKVLASQSVGGLRSPCKIGQSYSDPLQTQTDADKASSTADSRVPSRRNSDTSDVVTETPHTSIVLQPDSKPMPEKQLAAEIKAIYSGLVMIEQKCISVDNAESARLKDIRSGKKPRSSLTNNQNQWPAIISLHRSLLQEHHDFFLASQHHAASEPLRRLAEKYSMPERMWKHGIRSPLELFRFGLPYSKEYMIAFLILSYQMICLLYETVTSFEDTWTECLGDLARYRMAIEDEVPKDREIWSNVSRSWYAKASSRQPRVGRLYHHQAILARHNPIKQLCFYARALNATQVFVNARESIMTLFDPILSRLDLPGSNKMTFDSHFIRLQAMIFTNREMDTQFNRTLNKFLDGFSGMIEESGAHFKVYGEYMANILVADLFSWASPSDTLRKLFTKDSNPAYGPKPDRSSSTPAAGPRLRREWFLTFKMLEVVLENLDNENVLPFLLLMTTFLAAMVLNGGISYIDKGVPIEALTNCGNSFQAELDLLRLQTENKDEHSGTWVLETMHGQVWTEGLIPENARPRQVDYEEVFELPEPPNAFIQKGRIVEMLKIMAFTQPSGTSEYRRWLTFDKASTRFHIKE